MDAWRLVRKRLSIIAFFHILGCYNLFSGAFELTERAYMTNFLLVALWPIAFIIETNISVKRLEKRKASSEL